MSHDLAKAQIIQQSTVRDCPGMCFQIYIAYLSTESHDVPCILLVASCCMECQEPRRALPHGLPSHSPEQLSALITSKLHKAGTLLRPVAVFFSDLECLHKTSRVVYWHIEYILTYWLHCWSLETLRLLQQLTLSQLTPRTLNAGSRNGAVLTGWALPCVCKTKFHHIHWSTVDIPFIWGWGQAVNARGGWNCHDEHLVQLLEETHLAVEHLLSGQFSFSEGKAEAAGSSVTRERQPIWCMRDIRLTIRSCPYIYIYNIYKNRIKRCVDKMQWPLSHPFATIPTFRESPYRTTFKSYK